MTGEGALIAVDDGANEVVHAWPAEPSLLADFLNDMHLLAGTEGTEGTEGTDCTEGIEGIEGIEGTATPQDGTAPRLDVTDTDPARWGELVIARSTEGGDILFIDPEQYWNGISELFRTRGDDPHPWRGRS